MSPWSGSLRCPGRHHQGPAGRRARGCRRPRGAQQSAWPSGSAPSHPSLGLWGAGRGADPTWVVQKPHIYPVFSFLTSRHTNKQREGKQKTGQGSHRQVSQGGHVSRPSLGRGRGAPELSRKGFQNKLVGSSLRLLPWRFPFFGLEGGCDARHASALSRTRGSPGPAKCTEADSAVLVPEQSGASGCWDGPARALLLAE